MKRNTIIAAFACFCVVLVSHVLADEGPETEIFDRASIDQFDFFLDENGRKADVFSFVGDETLRISGKPFGWLATQKEYKNFKLEVEYRWPSGSAATNSGVFLRMNGTSPNFLPRGFEIQLAHGSAGDIYGFHGMGLSGEKGRYTEDPNNKLSGHLRGVKKFRDAERAPGQWNKLKVYCFEGMIVVWMNDKIVNWAHDAEIVPGKIGFQSEGGPIEFKDAEITELY